MSTYKKIDTRNGIRYMKDKKFISIKNIPEDVLADLTVEKSVDTGVEPSDRKCIFCGAHTTMTKFVDQQTVYICEEHYYSKTTGQIAQQLRGVPSEKNEEKTEEMADEKNNPQEEVLI